MDLERFRLRRVLEGEFDVLLDDPEVHLATGDVVVQQWTNLIDARCNCGGSAS